MKIQWKALLLCLAAPLAVGGAAALLTREAMEEFALLRQPPLSPPAWAFPVAWTVLYLLRGLASYLVWTARSRRNGKKSALWAYTAQLLTNFLWPLLFFRAQLWLGAFFWLILLWAMVLGTLLQFYRLRPLAGVLMLPYLGWVTFAGYLNFGIYMLN